jgi:hypothetical protein
MNHTTNRDGRVYGAKYDGNLDTAQIAKRVRADLKAAIASGELPAMKASVRISRYSMGSSITVSLSDIAGLTLFNAERLRADCDQPHGHITLPIYTDEARAILDAVEAILAAYNYDASDSQTDYYESAFHANVDFDNRWESARREVELAALPPAPVKSPAIAPRVDLASLPAPDPSTRVPDAIAPPPPSNVVSILVASCLPYQLRTSCGHLVIRKMREATAGVPYSPDVILEAPGGRPCEACEKAEIAAREATWTARATCSANWAHEHGKGCDLCVP